MEDGLPQQRSTTTSVYDDMVTFEFIFILHLMNEVMEITDMLSQAVQCKSQDIVNAMHLVSSTKYCLQQLRENKWGTLIEKVKLFYERRNILTPEFDARYINRRGQAHQVDNFTIEDYYRVVFFYAAIDAQLQAINGRFGEDAIELLMFSSTLALKIGSDSFKIADICLLVDKYYPKDFTSYECEQLKMQLEHHEYNIVKGADYKNFLSISHLFQWLVKTRNSVRYELVFRVIVLVLTLPVSTTTTERSFSAMNAVKISRRNKMEDGFLSDALIVFIEKEIAKEISMDEIIKDFEDRLERRVLFH